MTSKLEAESPMNTDDARRPNRSLQLNGGPTPERAAELLKAVGRLIEEAETINTRAHEESTLEAINRELRSSMDAVLGETERVLAGVLEHYEATAPDEPEVSVPSAALAGSETSFEGCIDSLVESSGAQRIADLAFVVRLELARKKRKLSTIVNEDDPWEHIAAYASIRRGILKSAAALEAAICEYEDIAAQHRWYVDSVARAIRIRNAYARFRDALYADQPPTHLDVHRRIRGAGIAIAKLIGRDSYESFKIRDRRMLRELQRRVLQWLRGYPKDEPSEFYVRSGVRLWQDVVGLANLLMQVSNRPELRDHDAGVIGDLCEVLFGGFSPATRVMPAQIEQLLSLRGLDSQLDECVQLGEDCPMATWREVLLRLGERLHRKA